MKKLLSFVLAVVMVLGMTTVAFASTASDPKNAASYSLGESIKVDADDKVEGGKIDIAPTKLEAVINEGPDQKKIELAKVYIFKDGQNVMKKDRHKLSVNLRKASGSTALDSADIDFESSGEAYIVLKSVKQLVSTSKVDYKAVITMNYDGRRIKDFEITVEGSLENEKQEINDSDDKIYVDSGCYLYGKEYNKNLEIVMNDDISLFSRIFAGKKYYANINLEPSDSDITLMNKYTDILNFVEFKTIGLSSSEVKFNYADNMYAYTANDEGDIVYVGRTNSKLPFYTKYYVSAKELKVAEAPVEEGPTEEPTTTPDAPVENAEGGGDDIVAAPENNFNPGTGR